MKVHSDPLFHVAMCSGKKKSDQSLTHFCCCFQSMCFIKISQYRGRRILCHSVSGVWWLLTRCLVIEQWINQSM